MGSGATQNWRSPVEGFLESISVTEFGFRRQNEWTMLKHERVKCNRSRKERTSETATTTKITTAQHITGRKEEEEDTENEARTIQELL